MVPRDKIRWHHIASEQEIMRAMREKSGLDTVEVPMINQTFTLCEKYLTIVRSGAAGGDVREIYGGWVYANPILFLADKQEILELERNPMNQQLKRSQN
jgi:hypothetical protein